MDKINQVSYSIGQFLILFLKLNNVVCDHIFLRNMIDWDTVYYYYQENVEVTVC